MSQTAEIDFGLLQAVLRVEDTELARVSVFPIDQAILEAKQQLSFWGYSLIEPFTYGGGRVFRGVVRPPLPDAFYEEDIVEFLEHLGFSDVDSVSFNLHDQRATVQIRDRVTAPTRLDIREGSSGDLAWACDDCLHEVDDDTLPCSCGPEYNCN